MKTIQTGHNLLELAMYPSIKDTDLHILFFFSFLTGMHLLIKKKNRYAFFLHNGNAIGQEKNAQRIPTIVYSISYLIIVLFVNMELSFKMVNRRSLSMNH